VNNLFTQHSPGGSKEWKPLGRFEPHTYKIRLQMQRYCSRPEDTHVGQSWTKGAKEDINDNYVPLQLPFRTFSRLSCLQKHRQSVSTLNSMRHLVAIRFVRAGMDQFVKWLTTFWTFQLLFEAVIGIFCLPLFLFLCPWMMKEDNSSILDVSSMWGWQTHAPAALWPQ
jgi:hypothetical protein